MAEIVDGHLGDDGDFVAAGFARRQHRLAQLIQIAERFQDQQIDAGFQQRVDLFAESRPGFRERRGAERFDAHAQGSDGARHETAFPPAASRASRTPARLMSRTFSAQSESPQARAGGAEGIGLEDLGAGLDVLLVNLADQVGRRQIDLVEAAVDKDAARVEHGAHGPIGYDDAAL